MKLNHIAVRTTDLERSVEYWGEFFDAEIGARYLDRNPRGLAPHIATLPNEQARIEHLEDHWVAPNPGETCRGALLASQPRRTGDCYGETAVRSREDLLIELVAL